MAVDGKENGSKSWRTTFTRQRMADNKRQERNLSLYQHIAHNLKYVMQ